MSRRGKTPRISFAPCTLLLCLFCLACGGQDQNEVAAAIESYQKNGASQAVSQLEKLSQASPDNGDLRLYHGLALRDLGRLDEAISQLRSAIDLSDDSGRAHALLGNILRSQGKYEDAIEHLNMATKALPKEAAAWNNLGLALASAGNYEKALETYDQALGLAPNDPVPHYNQGELYRRLEQLPNAERSLTKALELSPDNCYVIFALAEVKFALDKVAEARGHYSKILALSPKELATRRGRILFQLGRAYFADRYFESATRSLKAAQRAGYDRNTIGLWQAIVLHEEGKFKVALELLDGIPQGSWEDLPKVAHYRGLCLYELERYNQALESFQQALDFGLPPIPIATRMGLSYLKLFDAIEPAKRSAPGPQALIAKAHALFDGTLRLAPQNLAAHMGRARAYFKAREPENALEAIDHVLSNISKNHAPAYLIKGLCLYDSTKLDAAISSLARYLRVKPESGRVRLFLAQVLAESGRLDDAVREFTAGIAVCPRDWDAKLMLSWVFTQQSNYVGASKLLLTILSAADDRTVLSEARKMYDLITRPFRALLFPETAEPAGPPPVVPGSLEYIKGKLQGPNALLTQVLDGPGSSGAKRKLQDNIRELIIDYNALRRKRLFLDDSDRSFYRNEIKRLIEAFKDGS